jgi:hypothetical protein
VTSVGHGHGRNSRFLQAQWHWEILNNETGLVSDGRGDHVFAPLLRVPLRLEYDTDTGEHVLRTGARLAEDAIRRWGLITGDAIHNLRGALDHLVWQLACYKTGSAELPGVSEREARRIQFPIDDTPPPHGDPRRFREDDNLQHVLPEHREVIYRHQPFGTEFNFGFREIPTLSRLRELSNRDKHRLIVPVAVLPQRFTGLRIIPEDIEGEAVETEFSAAPQWYLQGDAEIIRYRIHPPHIRVDRGDLGFLIPQIAFQDVIAGHTYQIEIYMELMNMRMQIRRLVEELEGLFGIRQPWRS